MTEDSADETVAEWPESDKETFEHKLKDEDPLADEEADAAERALNVLLVDYQTASEDARYRDRLITQTFYLTFVVGGLLLNGSITLLFQSSVEPEARYFVLAVISFVGVVSFTILLVFVESFQKSRESAWARRGEIESYVRSAYPGTLATNESITGSLTLANSDEEAETDESSESWFAATSAGRMMTLLLLGSIVLSMFALLASVSVYLLSWTVG